MRLLLMFVLLGSVSQLAVAVDWKDSELKLMPPYCAARLHRASTEQYRHWQNVLGPDYLHTHHYCNGIGYINRAYSARTAQSKTFSLQSAIGEISYVVAHASPTYSLMPEVYLHRGLALSLMKKDVEAIADMRKALELNPALTRAYSMLVDQYTKLNQKDEALKVATEGLRHVPDSQAMQRMYVRLGGKLPYPEPVTPKAAAPAVPPTEDGASQTLPKAESDVAAQPATPGTGGASKTAGPSDVQPAPKPEIGTPSNPWCRFCPDQ